MVQAEIERTRRERGTSRGRVIMPRVMPGRESMPGGGSVTGGQQTGVRGRLGAEGRQERSHADLGSLLCSLITASQSHINGTKRTASRRP